MSGRSAVWLRIWAFVAVALTLSACGGLILLTNLLQILKVFDRLKSTVMEISLS